MYIDIVPNRNSPPAVLLREARREGGKVVKRTIANLSKCPPEAVEALRLALRGVKLVPVEGMYAIERSVPHGHVEALLGVMRRIGLDKLITSRPCRERDLVMAMVAQQLLEPSSKLAKTRQWHTTTLAGELGVVDADENELYDALDWLLERKEAIERKLARRHLRGDAPRTALYDVSSSSYYGRKCPLAMYGKNRDEEKVPCIVYGVLADGEGRPVAVETYAGNTADTKTVMEQVGKLRVRFGLERVVLVGDRGMLTETRIEELKKYPGLGWISALRSHAIGELVEQGAIQLSLFDDRNMAEISSEAYPGERLIVCRNPLLAEDRGRTRKELLDSTERRLKRIEKEVKRRTKTPLKAAEIGLKVGGVVNRYKVAKHFDLDIRDGYFAFTRNEEQITGEAALDGIYIIRTSEPAERLSAEDTVRAYKSLAQVERAFRCLKGIDLGLRPICHRTEAHVKAHVFLCMLAYYVDWHVRRALSSVLFQDDELSIERLRRDPVAKAQPSASARRKKQTKCTEDGFPVHSLKTLMAELATRCKNTCRIGEGKNVVRFTQLTESTPFQQRVFALLAQYSVTG